MTFGFKGRSLIVSSTLIGVWLFCGPVWQGDTQGGYHTLAWLEHCGNGKFCDCECTSGLIWIKKSSSFASYNDNFSWFMTWNHCVIIVYKILCWSCPFKVDSLWLCHEVYKYILSMLCDTFLLLLVRVALILDKCILPYIVA